MASKRRTIGVLILISSCFAVVGAGAALGSDEVWSLRVIGQSYHVMMHILRGDVHPPLYYHLLRLWVVPFGTSEWSIRSLSGLFYVLSVLGVYGFARRLFGSSVAMLCAVIYLTSPLALIAAHSGRMYALLALLSVLSTWLFYEGRSGSWRTRTWVLYVAVNIAGTFTHIWFFFLLFAQIASFLLLGDKHEAKRFGLSMTLSLAPYSLVWLPTFVRQLSGSSEKAAWLSRPGLGDVGSVLFLYGGALWLLLPILLIAWRKGGKPLHFVLEPCRANPELVFILLTALGVPFLISFFKPVFYSRFTIVVLPLFALVAGALGARAVGETGRRQLVWLLIVISAAVGLSLRLMGNQCDSRWTAKYLASHVQEGDVVIFTSLSRLPTDYYLKRLKPQWSVWETSFPGEIDQHPGYEGSALKPGQQPRLRREADRLVGRIEASIKSGRQPRIFFLYGYRPETDRILKARLDKRFKRVDSDCIQCRISRSYYRRISVYQTGRSQTAGGRMRGRPGS